MAVQKKFLVGCALISLVIWVTLRLKSPHIRPHAEERARRHFHTKLNGTSGPGVILRTKGGIGNQLFQYACSYALARGRNNSALYHFIPGLPNRTGSDVFGPLLSSDRTLPLNKREFALHNFQVPLTDFIDATTVIDKSSRAYLNDYQLLSKEYPKQAAFLQQTGWSYCQSVEYWADYKGEILSMFQLRPEVIRKFPPYVTSLIKEIEREAKSVGVHVRRGDFTRLAGYDVPISYQRAAIRRLIKILEERHRHHPGNGSGSSSSPKFFVFSDDVEYAREKLKDFAEVHKFVFVSYFPDGSGRRTSGLEDFFLMSRCKHFIIPNSSFSWWVAYLATNWEDSLFQKSEQIVIASAFNPKYWEVWENFNTKRNRDFNKMLYNRSYYPKEWIIINTFEGEH